MKILVLGKGRHGKDEFSKMLGLPFKSTSQAALDEFVWEEWGRRNYLNKERCFSDRHNARDIWFNLYCDYNYFDKARFAKKVVETQDIYCGMRCKDEVQECIDQEIFDLIFWVDASERIEYDEGEDSCTVTADMCDKVIHNNGTLEDLLFEAEKVRFAINIMRMKE